MTQAEFLEAARTHVGRGSGIAGGLYRKLITTGTFCPDQFGLNVAAVKSWERAFSHHLLPVEGKTSQAGDHGTTTKILFGLGEGLQAEAVHIPMGRGRHTLCLSSQVGCKMGCEFCETAKMGLIRHLRTDEIVGQLLTAQHALGLPVRNIVFMGMGEALDNYDAVVQAIRIMTDSAGLAIAQERITVCTVGHVPGIRRLSREGFRRLGLSVSLNVAEDAGRGALMPIARKYDLATLQEALADFRPRANFCLGVNYCLMPELNDTAEDAARIADFCRPLGRVMVNLIPYNPGTHPLTRAPREDEIVQFVKWLRERGLPVRRRVTKGRDVMAACGQLGNLAHRRSKRALPLSPSSSHHD